MNKYYKLLFWIVFYLFVSFGIGQLTQGSIQGWYQALEKPSFNPPNYIFPIVWTLLYIMTATAGWNLWQVDASKNLKVIFVLYTLMNWMWTPIFFGFHQLTMGFYWIVALTFVNLVFIFMAWTSVRLSSVLVIPLFLWTSFASVLSYYIWAMNSV